MKITHHAYQRFSERTKFNSRQKNHNANQAYKHGYNISRFTGEFYEYLLTKQLDGDRTTVKILDTNIYIFDNRQHKLITVYPVPVEFLPVNKFLETKPERCVIQFKNGEFLTEGNSDEPIVFRSVQTANNYVKNCVGMGECMVVRLGKG